MEQKSARPGGRFQIGQFYLWYRTDRDDWNICWFENGRTHRVQTGIGGGGTDDPPARVQEALIAHHRKHATDGNLGPVAPWVLPLAIVFDHWLVVLGTQIKHPVRYAFSIANWQRFLEYLESQGDTRPRTVAMIDKGLLEDFVAFRRNEGVSAPTIARDMAAMSAALNWAVRNDMLTIAPKIPKIKGHRAVRQTEYSPEELAAIITVAASRLVWRHIHLFILMMIATHARAEALLDLMSDQIRNGLIFYNAEGREQTTKRRATVPIAPSLKYWLEGVSGKVILYRQPYPPGAGPEGAFIERPTKHVLLTYRKILLAAHEIYPELGLAEQAMSKDGEPLWLPPRAELGETEWRPLMRARGSPNALRHTIHTWCERHGVVRAQIEMAAGHVVGGESMGTAYSHLRPAYLDSFVQGVEALFDEMDTYTSAHRHPNDPKRPHSGPLELAPVAG